jgi:hypothetical protein
MHTLQCGAIMNMLATSTAIIARYHVIANILIIIIRFVASVHLILDTSSCSMCMVFGEAKRP